VAEVFLHLGTCDEPADGEYQPGEDRGGAVGQPVGRPRGQLFGEVVPERVVLLGWRGIALDECGFAHRQLLGPALAGVVQVGVPSVIAHRVLLITKCLDRP
jgi:hypothetical protein